MKISKVTLLSLVLIYALLIPDVVAVNEWLENYLEGMDQLLMIPWKYIFFYTWLILPRWVLCEWFNDIIIKHIIKVPKTSSSSDIKQNCQEGVKDYFDAVYYGGDPDYGTHAYFRAFV